MELSPAQKEAYARANTSTINIWAIEMRHPVWGAPVRVVQTKQNIDIQLEDNAPEDAGAVVPFTALAFIVSEPEVSGEPDSVLDISVDGVSGLVQPLLAEANRTGIPVEVAVRQVVYNVVTGVVGGVLRVIYLQLRSVAVTKSTVAMKLGYTNTANRSFPAINYTPQTNPGLL